jgi:hypothetical protein
LLLCLSLKMYLISMFLNLFLGNGIRYRQKETIDDLRQEIKKLATIFPQFKQVAEQRIEHTESLMRLREEYQREIQQEIEREMFTEKSPNYFSSL